MSPVTTGFLEERVLQTSQTLNSVQEYVTLVQFASVSSILRKYVPRLLLLQMQKNLSLFICGGNKSFFQEKVSFGNIFLADKMFKKREDSKWRGFIWKLIISSVIYKYNLRTKN